MDLSSPFSPTGRMFWLLIGRRYGCSLVGDMVTSWKKIWLLIGRIYGYSLVDDIVTHW